MSRSVALARLLAIGGILETTAGLALLIAPVPLASFLFRSDLELSA